MELLVYSSILLGIAFLLVIGILIRKIVQLNLAIKAKVEPASPKSKGKGKSSSPEEEPPPWAGSVDAKTTVFVFPTLIVKDSSDVEHSYRLGFEEFTIGRASDNQLVVAGSKVAPHHATIKMNDTGYVVEDHDTSSGTLVNGKKVGGKQRLSHDDCVTVGDTQIFFKVT